MPRTLLFFCLLFFTTSIFSQSLTDSIQIVKEKRKTIYYSHSRTLSFLDLKKIVEVDPEAATYMEYANQNRITSDIFIGLGIITFGFFTIYQFQIGNFKSFTAGPIIGLVGGGIYALISIPFNRKYKQHTQKAVDIYNSNLKKSTNISFGVTNSGVGLVMTL